MVCLTADFIRQCKRGDFSAKRCRPTSLRTKPAIQGERLLPAVTSDISSSSHPEDTTGDTGTSFLARGRAHTETVRSRCEFETYEEAYTVASTFSQRQEGVTKTREQSTKNQNRSLAHLSHLHLNYRNIDSIASETALELPNLQVLYLIDNNLSDVTTIGYLPSLRGLYLQSNELTCTKGLEQLPCLTELNLDDNKISRLEGLDSSTSLSRLSLTAQRTTTPLFLCPNVLTVLSRSLQYLNISKNRVEDLAPFGTLQFLEVLQASENLVREIGSIEAMLVGCRMLSTVDLRRNPVTKVRHYWERLLLGASTTLKEADGRQVTNASRFFVQELQKRRCAIMRQKTLDANDNLENSSNSQFPSRSDLATNSL